MLEEEPLTRQQLMEALKAKCQIAEKTAYRWINQADEAGLIAFDAGEKAFMAA